MRLDKFIMISECITDGTVNMMQEAGKPDEVCGVKAPDDLNNLTFGQLVTLQSIQTLQDIVFIPCEELLHVKRCKVMKEDALTVMRFSFWVADKVKEIGEMFKALSILPTPEEKQAGIDSLNFGLFGTIDWYAKRMGMKDHEDVESVPWIRIYKCIEIDNQKQEYERRLRHVYENKSKK